MESRIISLYHIGEYCKNKNKRLSQNILYLLFLISLCFCSVENPQSKNNKRNFSVFAYFANLPVNLNIITTQAGNRSVSHTDPKAILLDNGKVIIIGRGAELFDSSTLSFETVANRTLNRTRHTLTKMQNGKILILGGNTSTVELYDSSTSTFSNTGTMIQSLRSGNTTTLLPNGKVLVTGGYQTSAPSTSFITAELYDPTTGIFTSTGNMNYARQLHNATLLNDGTVLIAGGYDSQSLKVSVAEIYNPTTGLFTSLSNSSCQSTSNNTAVLLTNKNVLIANTSGGGYLQFFDITSNNCTIIQQSLREINTFPVSLLKDGRVIFAGGYSNATKSFVRDINIYDPNSNSINYPGNMILARTYPLTVVLSDGRVLIFSILSLTTEIYTP